MNEILDTLKNERKKYTEFKAYEIIPLDRYHNQSIDAEDKFRKIFYDQNILNKTQAVSIN